MCETTLQFLLLITSVADVKVIATLIRIEFFFAFCFGH